MRGLLHLSLLARLSYNQLRSQARVHELERTSVPCNADNFFRSSDPRFVMARVVSVRSCLEKSSELRDGSWRTNRGRYAHRLLRNDDESREVPSWSTSLRIPCTFAFILNTWIERDDCRFINAVSSHDCGASRDELRGCVGPDSMSWKLMTRICVRRGESGVS